MQVSPGDLVVTEKLRYVDVNQQIKISRVLMLGSRYESIIGRPLVPGAYVTAAIEVRHQWFQQDADGPVHLGMPMQEHMPEDMQYPILICEASMQCRSNFRMPRYSSSRSGGERIPGGSRDTDR